MNGIVSKNNVVPSIPDIQRTLVKIGDKEPKFLDSTDWIGANECSYVLDELLKVECKIDYLPSGDDIKSKGRELSYHFDTIGSPIMIGNKCLI